MHKLFTPNQMGSLEVKNRIVMPAMHMNFTPDGEINDKALNFYAERARGGAGLIIVGGCAIDDVGSGPMMINVSDRKYLDGLKKLTNTVKREGANVAAQLYQAGRYSHSAFSGKQPVAPSPIASRLTKEEPRALTIEEIKDLQETFANAALIVKEAGFDAVEIIGSAGYIISQFLSPITNHREDEYGGSFENRMRFGLEVVEKVREAVGENYPVIFRVGGNDYMAGSNTNVEITEFCRRLDETGIEALNVTGGWHETRVPQLTMQVPPGTYVYLAENIKRNVNTPVIACNRINDPHLADKILSEGRADFVGVARGMIADPEFPLKAQNGESHRIRKCIGCNQGCLDNVFSLQPVNCLVNARAGRENEVTIQPAEKTKRVLIIGGGVAGMEAARVTAMRGHEVSLWEKDEELGGQIHLAATPPGRSDFLHLYEYLAEELHELKVDVTLSCEATPEKVNKGNFDVVITATGAKPLKPDIPGVNNENVVTAWDILAGKKLAGDSPIVIGGGAVGIETSLYLADQGALSAESLKFLFLRDAENVDVLKELASRGHKKITMIEMLKKIGQDIGLSTRWTLVDELRRSGVSVLKNTTVNEITANGVIVEEEGGQKEINGDTVILALGSCSENALHENLQKEFNGELYLIGDAYKPQKALEAIHSAFDVGLKV